STTPLLKPDLTLPEILERGEALIHLRRRCLRAMAPECPARRGAVTLLEHNRRGQELWCRGIETESKPAWTGRDSVRRESGKVQSRGCGHRTRLEELRNDVPDESVVRVSIPTLGAPRDDRDK